MNQTATLSTHSPALLYAHFYVSVVAHSVDLASSDHLLIFHQLNLYGIDLIIFVFIHPVHQLELSYPLSLQLSTLSTIALNTEPEMKYQIKSY